MVYIFILSSILLVVAIIIASYRRYKKRFRLLVQGCHPYAKSPTLATSGSVGYDLFSTEDVDILPYSRRLVDTGLMMAIPYGYYGRIAPRSSLAITYSIDIGAGVIDPDYRGEIKVLMINNSNQKYMVKKGDKIAQLILEKVLITEVKVVRQLNTTIRGSGGFGSTGAT